MTMAQSEPSETSPLLPKLTEYVDPGDAPNGVLPRGDESRENANGHGNGLVKPDDGEERQQDDGEEPVLYQGMPEVKKKLKYILPAIAIGVSFSLVNFLQETTLKVK